MARIQPPDHLPGQVLDRADFRAACAERDLGVMLHLANKWGGPGFTISHIARRCEMGITQVQSYIKGTRQARDIGIFDRVADGLRIPGAMLGVSVRPWEEGGLPSIATSSPAEDSVAQIGISATGQIGIDATASEDPDIFAMIQEADRTDIGSGTIDGLYAVFDKLCRDYPSASAPQIRLKLKRLYLRVMQLRQGRITLVQHKELIAISGWITALLACVDWDVNERESAETARYATQRFAEEIGHGELTAWSYELQAWFALTEGRYNDVTSIARDAQGIGGENSAIVQLVMQEARGWARLGNRTAAESAMQRGFDLLQRLPPARYPRHFVYDGSKFPFYAASCYQWLGDDTKAEQYAREVISECETNGTTERSPMRMAEVYITLGLIQAQRGELDAAVDSGARALTFGRRSEPHLFTRLTEFRAALDAKFAGTRELREFDAQLRRARRKRAADDG